MNTSFARNAGGQAGDLVIKRYGAIFVHQNGKNRGVEQLVARWAHNPKVTGSSPVPATNKPPRHCLGVYYFDGIWETDHN